MHVADVDGRRLRAGSTEQLGAYVRDGLSRRDTAKVEEHLDECRRARRIYLELTEVNSNLAALAGAGCCSAPRLRRYLAAGSGSIGAGVVVVGLLDRAKDVVAGHTLTSAAAGVAATVVIGGAVVVGTTPDDVRLAGDPPPGKAGDRSSNRRPRPPDPGRPRPRALRAHAGAAAAPRQAPSVEAPRTRPADDVPSARRADDPSEPGDDPTTPGASCRGPRHDPAGRRRGADSGARQDVRLVVDTHPGGLGDTGLRTVAGLTGDQGGDLRSRGRASRRSPTPPTMPGQPVVELGLRRERRRGHLPVRRPEQRARHRDVHDRRAGRDRRRPVQQLGDHPGGGQR